MKDSIEDDKQDQKDKSGFKERLAYRNLGWRLLVGFICILCLAAFLHFREARTDVLDLNTKAPHFVVSQVDFEFPDEESTLLIKRDALRDIGTIYKIEEREISEVRFEFESFLIKNPDWKSEVHSSFEELYKAADSFEDVLRESRFTDARTLQKMKEFNLPMIYYQELTPHSSEKSIHFPNRVWDRMKKLSSRLDKFNSDSLQFVIDFFRKKNWKLQEDIVGETYFRQLIEKSIPDRYTKVKAGTKIIDQGERVASKHIAMLQAMKSSMNESRNLWEVLPIISSVLLAFIFVGLSAFYFKINKPELFYSVEKLALLASIVVLCLIFAKIAEYVILKGTPNFFDTVRYPIIIPLATLLICILLSAPIALYASTFLVIIMSIGLAVDHSRFLILNLVTSLMVIILTKALRKRKEIFGVCLKAYLLTIPVLLAFNFSFNSLWSKPLLGDLISSFVFLMISAILVVGLLPMLESLFRVMTEMTLMEYMDPNNELLRRLTIEIPGTYQHCLVLGNLTEAMAQSIGADGLFCRVAVLYHDIGKLNNPHFFTENQQVGVNIHQLLTPLESAQVIISHVTDGEILARKYRLPKQFIDIIREHHGTTLVYYFYCKELELKGGKTEDVDEKQFRYPGPKPYSKESAIIMIADTVEAASRSLDDFSEESLKELVNRLVKDRVEDNQLDECLLTFQDLQKIKETLVKTLLLTHHIRVKYPQKKEPGGLEPIT